MSGQACKALTVIRPLDLSSEAATHSHFSATFRNPYRTVSPFGAHRVWISTSITRPMQATVAAAVVRLDASLCELNPRLH